jgi:23S rRNA (adenine2503-C2)-methyltransferase
MTNLSKDLQSKLQEAFVFPVLEKKEVIEAEEILKFLWQLKDGLFVESVVIFSEERVTLCLSSQVGCYGKCSFCASGKSGFFRNLSLAEIVEQYIHINREMNEKEKKITHIVFMGMGEPLENYENVVSAIKIFSDPEKCQISQRRISLSTVGITEKIDQLAKEDFSINLVLSLHAPNQNLRSKIIPYAKKYPLDKLLESLDRYFAKTKRNITYEYIMIKDVNDSLDYAEELGELLQIRQCSVNLIPYNPVEGVFLQRPEKEQIIKFCAVLEEDFQIPTTWRYTKGKDIQAACGQLALKKSSCIL